VSCNLTSNLALERAKPVKPPILNKKIKPRTQNILEFSFSFLPKIEESQLKIFTPVGTAIIIVAAEK
jgi:hypothetical protein